MADRRSKKGAPVFQQVIVRMPPELHQAIKDRAAAEDRTMSQAVRRAVRHYLEVHPEPEPV